jgi:hypothetical protein
LLQQNEENQREADHHIYCNECPEKKCHDLLTSFPKFPGSRRNPVSAGARDTEMLTSRTMPPDRAVPCLPSIPGWRRRRWKYG